MSHFFVFVEKELTNNSMQLTKEGMKLIKNLRNFLLFHY